MMLDPVQRQPPHGESSTQREMERAGVQGPGEFRTGGSQRIPPRDPFHQAPLRFR